MSIPSCQLSDGESPGYHVHDVSYTPVLAIEMAVGIIIFDVAATHHFVHAGYFHLFLYIHG